MVRWHTSGSAGEAQISQLSVTARQAGPPEDTFVGKLLNKAEQVRCQLAAAPGSLGVPCGDVEGWQVVPLIVTPGRAQPPRSRIRA